MLAAQVSKTKTTKLERLIPELENQLIILLKKHSNEE
jgi:hypothetical protein